MGVKGGGGGGGSKYGGGGGGHKLDRALRPERPRRAWTAARTTAMLRQWGTSPLRSN